MDKLYNLPALLLLLALSSGVNASSVVPAPTFEISGEEPLFLESFEDFILTGFQQVRHEVPAANFQALFDTMIINGYRPVWIDGYEVNAQTYINAIFDESEVSSWTSAHGMDATAYQNYFSAEIAAGRRLVHVDSYRHSGITRYAAIFVEQAGTAWAAYHNVTIAQHQDSFNSNIANGFRPAVISLVDLDGGDLRVTALYDKDPVGNWVALANMTLAQYETQFATQTGAGLTLAYFNGYANNGSANISAIWISVGPASWVARHNLTSAQYQTEFDTWTGVGLITRIVSGYQNGAVANFGAYWTD